MYKSVILHLLYACAACAISEDAKRLQGKSIEIQQAFIERWDDYRKSLPEEDYQQLTDELKASTKSGIRDYLLSSISGDAEVESLSNEAIDTLLTILTDTMWKIVTEKDALVTDKQNAQL